MKVLGIGQVVIDKSIILREFLTEDSKVRPEEVKYSVGGPVAAAMILLARLGADCKLVGTIGKDEPGELVRTLLASERIGLVNNTSAQTKENIVLVNAANASRTIIHSQIEHEFIPSVDRDLIREADLILFDRHEPLAFEYVLKYKSAQSQIIADTSTEVSARTLGMLKAVNHPIVAIEILEKIDKSADKYRGLEKLFELIRKPIIVTAGAAGSIFFDGKNLELYPAYKVAVVDSLGAGDIYRGAFSYGIMQSWELPRIIDFANAVAALQCQRFGNGTAIPTKQEIENLLQVGVHQDISLESVLR